MVGSANVDLVVRVPHRPRGGETLLGGELLRLPGGKGANQAVAAARCGARVEFVACLGEDAEGAFLLDALSGSGVGIAGAITGARPTGTAIIMLTPDGENAIVVSPGANAELDVEGAERASGAWEPARVVVLSLEIPLGTVSHVAARASATGARVVVNAAPPAALDRATLAVCDPLIVNEHEARALLGGVDGAAGADGVAGAGSAGAAGARDAAGDPARLAVRLLEIGAASVVVTLGAAGSVVAEAGSAIAGGAVQDGAVRGDAAAGGAMRIPAPRVPVVDTTGAGDAFVGAVACELARGSRLIEAVRFATVAASLSVQRLGAQASYAERAEIDAALRAEI